MAAEEFSVATERLCIRIVYGVWIERMDVIDLECANYIALVQWSYLGARIFVVLSTGHVRLQVVIAKM